MFGLPDLNELAASGVEVTIKASPVAWNGKTRLVHVDPPCDGEGIIPPGGLVTIETKAGAIRYVKGDHVQYLSVRPAPRRFEPDGSVRAVA
jgi:hypothetical protein